MPPKPRADGLWVPLGLGLTPSALVPRPGVCRVWGGSRAPTITPLPSAALKPTCQRLASVVRRFRREGGDRASPRQARLENTG